VTAPPEQRLVVAEAEAGLRLDAFLARRALVPSAAAARRWLAEGRVRLDGRSGPGKKGERLVAGQEVLVSGAPQQPPGAQAPAPLVVLYQDAAVVAIDKPAGIPSHPLRPGEAGTAVDALLARFPECALASVDPREGGLVHRLDVGTSGVLLAARDRQSWDRLRGSFAGPGSRKRYLAEVVGLVPDPPGGEVLVVDAAIGRVGRRGGQVRIDAGRSPMAARTEVRVRARRPGPGGATGTTVVEATLERGRPHQVRVHLAHLGFPVVGDPRYGAGGEPGSADVLEPGLHLHAWKVQFRHPTSGELLEIVATPPAWAGEIPVNSAG
jgi:23S rRNA pseudouridine1911/1915/1917 synthase